VQKIPLVLISLMAACPALLHAQEIHPLKAIAPAEVAIVTSREAGFLESVEIDVGDKVEEGQLLMKLDHDRQLHSYLTAKVRAEDRSGIEIAEGDLREKNANLSYVQERHRKRNAVDEDVEKAQAQAQMARGRLEQARTRMELAKLELALAERLLENRYIRAPIDGTVVNIFKPQGTRVNLGDNVVTVADLENLATTVPISKDSLTRIAVGSSIPVRIPGSESLRYARIASVDPIEGAPDGQHAMKLIFENMSPTTPLAALAAEAILPPGVEADPTPTPKPKPKPETPPAKK
jgi:multidrug resistance efflux pump